MSNLDQHIVRGLTFLLYAVLVAALAAGTPWLFVAAGYNGSPGLDWSLVTAGLIALTAVGTFLFGLADILVGLIATGVRDGIKA